MTHDSHEPQSATAADTAALPVISPSATRHDGWTGEKMAIFCEALADTAVVAEACEVARMGISGAYAARRRNPVFAAAWEAALTMARERLADTLLARSMEGNIEQIYKDGELIGERHLLDNRLGLAILKRLDKMAETKPCSCEGRSPNALRQQRFRAGMDPCLRRGTGQFDWTTAIDALRTGDEAAVCTALALFEGNEVEEVEDYPLLSGGSDEPEEIDLHDRCWKVGIDELPGAVCQADLGIDGNWLTDFPPPPGFSGYESCDYGDPEEKYERACTGEEVAILEAHMAAERGAALAEEEALRDEWFAILKVEADAV